MTEDRKKVLDWDALDAQFNPPPKSASYLFGLWLGEWLALKMLPLAIGAIILTVVVFVTWKTLSWIWGIIAGS